MQILDTGGTLYHLGQSVGQGGEATIYTVAEHRDLLAKIYTHPRARYERKIAWMRDNPPDDPTRAINHASIAWPLDLVYTPQSQFAGYLMPYIEQAAPLLSVFNPRLRSRVLPHFNALYLHRTARNLSVALSAVHERGYVVGDLNESNVMVTESTLVSMIDTDSFQVSAKSRMGRGELFRCLVGKPEYTPPELQKRSFAEVIRQSEHDYFALGVLIFQLLMDGSHPFRAKWDGESKQPPIEERILRGWFPYRQLRGIPIRPPSNALPIMTLHPEITELLYRCFVDGHKRPRLRPEPEEWEQAVAHAEADLDACAYGHFYSTHLDFCPHCEREAYVDTLEQMRMYAPRAASPARTGLGMASRPRPSPPRPPLLPPIHINPTFNLSKPTATIQSAWYMLAQAVAGSLGQLMLVLFFGAVAGGLAGDTLGGSHGGGTMGVIGGLISGGIVSDTIKKTIGWEVFGGFAGGALGGWLVWGSSASDTMLVASIGIGAAVGALFGAMIKQFDLTILGAFVGAAGGWVVGSVLGNMVDGGWIGGAVSGMLFGGFVGVLYIAHRKLGI